MSKKKIVCISLFLAAYIAVMTYVNTLHVNYLNHPYLAMLFTPSGLFITTLFMVMTFLSMGQ